MNRKLLLTALAALTLPTLLPGTALAQEKTPAPNFIGKPADWVNGAPQDLTKLKGKVVIVAVWTFECINCKRTLKFWNEWAKKYANKDVVIVSIHTPELESERDPKAVEAFAKKNGLTFPILIDNDLKNWKAWSCRFWPSTGIVDKKGRIRAAWEGELDWKSSGEYKKVEQLIERLRKEE